MEKMSWQTDIKQKDIVCIEEPHTAYVQAIPHLPPAPVSTKPDMVVKLSGVLGYIEGPIKKLVDSGKLDPHKHVVSVSHKTEGKRFAFNERMHRHSIDTVAQYTVWNELHWELPMVGVLMNIVGKQKDPQIYRFFQMAEEHTAEQWKMARQVDWWLKAKVAPTKSGNCRKGYGGLCQYHELCHSKEFPAVELSTLHASQKRNEVYQHIYDLAKPYGFKHSPWEDRDTAPSKFGMSRYGIINSCGMEHELSYAVELAPIEKFGAALQVGIGFHAMLSAHYRGGQPDDEDRLGLASVEPTHAIEAARLYAAYVDKWGGSALQLTEYGNFTDEG